MRKFKNIIKNKISKKLYGINKKTMWAVFAPDGHLQFRTISENKKDAKTRTIGYHETGIYTWADYAKKGFVCEKIFVDIKFFK